MLVLTYLFYITGVLFLMYEIFTLKHFVEYYNFRIKPDKDDDERIFSCLQGSFVLFYWLWSFIGLFTSQWFLFLILLIINGSLLGTKNTTIIMTVKFINGLMLLFIFLNKFNLKIDIVSLIF